ncbi:MAG: hypothetical protein AAF211_17485 [Myxococcota bacterium]
MWLWLFAEAAVAQGCPQIPDLVESAWTAYEIAELDEARDALADAGDALTCQDRLVRRETLREMFLLTAQVALTLDDEVRMATALERAVGIDARAEARPGVPYSPELIELWAQIAGRLRHDRAEVKVTGVGVAYVDGRRADAQNPLSVSRGLHLVQTLESEGFRSEVLLVLGDYVIATPGSTAKPPRPILPAPELRPPSTVTVDNTPEPLQPLQREPRRGRTRRIVAGTGAAVAGAVAAFTLASGAVSERSFSESSYNGPVVPFYGVERGQPLYEQARRQIIEFDANNINLLYGIGYASAAVSAGLLTVAILPPKRAR